MNILFAIFLGIIQGLTEFLPVSSSGHLALIQNIFGDVDIGFDAFLHLATLLAVVVFFFKDIIKLVKGFFSFSWGNEDFRISIYIIIATIPAGIAGYFFRNAVYSAFSSLNAVAFGLIITSLFLFAASFGKEKREIGFWSSFVTGLSQALALLPGISRSGSTVSTGILFGVERARAIRFSFLLSIPAILGAFMLSFQDIKIISLEYIMGFIFAFIFGLFAIFVFIRKIQIKNFRLFACYCFFLALLIFLLGMFGVI